ncbi:uncharacterized protein L969DRAFT_86822 [Mixia osmundae IAM 14324]|nr:uncharacterized protein L969DRAFT_86822 [Mixia osmundae IAM 14324]KEI40199.1 hypothetical protein L969DRAFT_86822 [Mixia osmundae IAM 14324]
MQRTVVRLAGSSLRLIALPLCRKPALTYYQAQLRQSETPSTADQLASSSGGGSTAVPPPAETDAPKASLITRATNKGGELWSKLGKGPPDGWKRTVFNTGEKLMDKIEYEEWALKQIDPEVAPKPIKRAGQEQPQHVAIIYPDSVLSGSELLDALQKQLADREPHHKTRMYRFLLGSPITWPFALIPVVPNFPLFYMLWRGWSHWRAYKATMYLRDLFEHDNVKATNSARLNQIYAAHIDARIGSEQVESDAAKTGSDASSFANNTSNVNEDNTSSVKGEQASDAARTGSDASSFANAASNAAEHETTSKTHATATAAVPTQASSSEQKSDAAATGSDASSFANNSSTAVESKITSSDERSNRKEGESDAALTGSDASSFANDTSSVSASSSTSTSATETGTARRSTDASSSPADAPSLLLTKEDIPKICSTFGLDEQAAIDIRRAIEQAQVRLTNAQSPA